MSRLNFRQGLAQIRSRGGLGAVLGEAFFPIPSEIAQGMDPETIKALHKQSVTQLGLGMMAAPRSAGLGGALQYGVAAGQETLQRGLGQIMGVRRANREDERQNLAEKRTDAQLQRQDQLDTRTVDWRNQDIKWRESQAAADAAERAADNARADRALNAQLQSGGPAGTWSKPFEAMDPMSGKPGMFQSHSLTGEIRQARVGPGQLGPKPNAGGSDTAPESLIYRQVVGYFGGVVDPQTGGISGLDPTQRARAQEMAANAMRLHVNANGALTTGEAVAQAARGVKPPPKPLPSNVPRSSFTSGNSGGYAMPRSQPVAPQAVAQQQAGGLPPAAAQRLKPGIVTTFSNGQRWTIKDGKPVQVQ